MTDRPQRGGGPDRHSGTRPTRAEHSGRRRRVRILLAVALLAIGLGTATWYVLDRPPSPTALIARAQRARAAIGGVSFVLTSPWPQAQPPVSGLPGARTLLGGVDGERSWRVLWRSDGSMRAELREPADAAGTLTILTPTAAWVWSPLLKVAISGEPAGAAPLWVDGVLAAAAAGVGRAGRVTVAGGAYVADFPVATPQSGRLRVSFDRRSGLPVAADLLDVNGRLLGALEVSEMDLSPAVGDDDFDFAPPEGTRVIAVGRVESLPDVSSAAAAAALPPVEPGHLPAGFELAAVNLFGRGEGASLVLTYRRPGDGDGAVGGLLSLTQARAGAGYLPLPYGTPVTIGGSEGRSFELGELRGLDWRAGDYALSLFGTVSAAELLQVAASVR